MNARIQRLRGEIAADREALGERLDRLDSLVLHAGCGEELLALAAWDLHHAYSALESILERCTRFFEGVPPQGPDWHRALLDGAALRIPEVRPPLLSRPVVRALHELLAFRHFVRHAYAVHLDAERLSDLRARALQVRPPLERDLDALDAWLAEVAAAG